MFVRLCNITNAMLCGKNQRFSMWKHRNPVWVCSKQYSSCDELCRRGKISKIYFVPSPKIICTIIYNMQHQLPQSPVLSCTTPYEKHLDKLKLLGRFSLNHFWLFDRKHEKCKHFLKETCYSCDVNNLTVCHQVRKWHSDCQGNTWGRAIFWFLDS